MTDSKSNSREESILAQLEEALPLEERDDKQTTTLYHYTDGAGFVGMIQKGELWASHALHLNDREELKLGQRLVDAAAETVTTGDHLADELLRKFCKAHKKVPLSEVADLFLASFSEDGDLLSQWRGYASGGAGFSVGFAQLPMPKEGVELTPDSLALMLAKVEYDEQKLQARMRHQFRRLAESFAKFVSDRNVSDVVPVAKRAVVIMLRQAALLVPRAKHSAFAEEREWRLLAAGSLKTNLVCHRARATGVVPFVKIPAASGRQFELESVILGPLQNPETGPHGARSLLKTHGYSPDLVRPSQAPYRI